MNSLYIDKKVINIIDDCSDLCLDLNEKQMIIINCFFDIVKNMHIDVNQHNNSCLVINYAGYVRNDASVNINVNVLEDNNKTVINVRTLDEASHADFFVSVKANDNTVNNEIIEDLKAINEEGTITFMPVLKINTNEVKAEHYATIGGFDEDELFYLESKKISTDKAKDILKKSFINSLFSNDFLKMLDNRKEKDE